MNLTKALAVPASLTLPVCVCRPRSDRRVHQQQSRLCAVRGGMPSSCLAPVYEGRGALPLFNASPGPLRFVFPEKVNVIYRDGAEEETGRRLEQQTAH